MSVPGWVRRHTRIAALSLGIVVSVGTMLFSMAAPNFFASITGNPAYANYDARPQWFAALMSLVGWLVWIGLAVLIAIRVTGRRWSRPLAYFGGMATVYVGLLAFIFGRPVFDEYRNEREFESAAWRANDTSDPSWPTRLRMADDLMETGRLSGLHRTEVERLLGPPDETTMWKDWDMVYLLGPERGLFGLDSEWLVIRLGSDGRVLRHEIVRD